ncbi:MAG: hypothetical protein IJ741_02045 [Schwartzia sp.]|nr:hypothetical protein [Schwartzia sp. (in: firmicutes)]
MKKTITRIGFMVAFWAVVLLVPAIGQAAPVGEFLGIDTWSGDTITFRVRIYMQDDSNSFIPDMGQYLVSGFRLHLVVTDSESGEVVLDTTKGYSGGEVYVWPGSDAEIPVKTSFPELNKTNNARFNGTITNISCRRMSRR